VVLKVGKSSYIAKGGLFVALTVLILYFTTFLQFNTLFIIGIASAIIPLSVITTDIKNSIMVFLAASLLSYFLLPIKSVWMLYAFVFGPYGIIKYYLERIRSIPIEILCKLFYFNIVALISFYLYKKLFVPNFSFDYNIILIIFGAEFMFILFDYALTAFINTVRKYNLK